MVVKIPEKVVDVKEEVDVVVVGGGPAGVAAAVSAARTGARVALVEGRGYLGGNLTGACVEFCNHFLRNVDFEVTGIYADVKKGYNNRYGRSHFVYKDGYNGEGDGYNSEYLKIYLDEFVLNARVKLYFHAFVNDVIVEKDNIKYVVLQTKQGSVVIGAKVVIDSTGDGDVAFFAGVPYKMGREKDGLCQPITLQFRIAGIDMDRFREHPNSLWRVREIMLKLREKDPANLKCKRNAPVLCGLTDAGVVSEINFADIYAVDPTNADDLTRGQIETRRHIGEIMEYFRKNIEGMQKIELVQICPELGLRDSRRISGLYELSIDDIENDRVFDDAIARFPRFYDMLSLDGDWVTPESDIVPEANRLFVLPEPGAVRSYQIPYRCLVPVKIDNLLVTGRCISADHVAESSIRAIVACMETGQAAGCAAGIAAADGTRPRDVDIKKLQGILKQQGVKL